MRVIDSLGAVGGPGLGVDVADVAVGSVETDHERVGDLLVAPALGNETKDFDLAR
jgi:hypothetical protein